MMLIVNTQHLNIHIHKQAQFAIIVGYALIKICLFKSIFLKLLTIKYNLIIYLLF